MDSQLEDDLQNSDAQEVEDERGAVLDEGELNERTAKAYLFQVTSTSDNAPDRQIAIRCIVNVVENCKEGDEHDEQQVEDLFRLITDKFAVDCDPLVRAELLEVLPSLCMHCCHQSPWLRPYVDSTLLPLLAQFLNDLNIQVRKTCQAAIVILLEQKLLEPELLEKSICPVLISLSEDYRSEDVRVEAVQLLCKIISTALKPRTTVTLFLPKFTSLCQDSLFHIRKACAGSIGQLSRLLGTSMTERVLVPHLIALSQDSVWGVRKACAEVFTQVSNQSTMNIRKSQLASVFIVLLADNSRWVQSAAFQSLGPFISTFADANRTGLKWINGELSYEQPTDANSDLESCSGSSIDGLELPANVIVPPVSPPVLPGHESPAHDDDFMSELDLLLDDSPDSFVTPDSPSSSDSDDDLHVDHTHNPANGTSEITGEKDSIEDAFSTFRYWQSPLEIDDGQENNNKSEESVREESSVDSFMRRQFVPKDDSIKVEEESEDSDDEPLVIHAHDLSNKKSECASAIGAHSDHGVEKWMPTLGVDQWESQDMIPQALLDNFISMVEPYRAQTVESDISRHCAFNLPAVALTMGRQHWHHLKPTYLSLANDMQWKVRRTLAFSIHELAAILGHTITAEDLLPVFQSFVRDLDEVRIGVLKHLFDFIKLLDMPTRKWLLMGMADFLQTDNIRNWRFRLLLAEQLVLLCELYAIEDVNEYLSPIAMTLAIDKVSVIRKATYLLLAKILGYFYDVEFNVNKSSTMDITNSFTQDIIKGFACSQRWNRRQTYVYTVKEVVRGGIIPDNVLRKELLPALLKLAHDRIPNVRISLAYVLSTEIHRLGHLPGVSNAVDILANDSDLDCTYLCAKNPHKFVTARVREEAIVERDCEDMTELRDDMQQLEMTDPQQTVKWTPCNQE